MPRKTKAKPETKPAEKIDPNKFIPPPNLDLMPTRAPVAQAEMPIMTKRGETDLLKQNLTKPVAVDFKFPTPAELVQKRIINVCKEVDEILKQMATELLEQLTINPSAQEFYFTIDKGYAIDIVASVVQSVKKAGWTTLYIEEDNRLVFSLPAVDLLTDDFVEIQRSSMRPL